jgi:hypothetical protein
MKNIKFRTGDIMLYKADDLLASIIQFFTNGDYYHCSMVLVDPVYINETFKGTYIIESTFRGRQEYGTSTGVQVLSMDTLIEETIKKNKNGYKEELFYRKLNYKRDKKFYDLIATLCKGLHNNPYDIDVRGFLSRSLLPKNIDSIKEKRYEFGCSTLVAYIYKKIGLLSKDTNWTKLSPTMFSSLTDEPPEFTNCILDEEIKII